MNLEQLEINLTKQGFKVSKYLTPEDGTGFALSHPALSDKVEIVVLYDGERYEIFRSTPTEKGGIHRTSYVSVVYGYEVPKYVMYHLKSHIFMACKKLWTDISQQLTIDQYRETMNGGDTSFKSIALRAMKISNSKTVHSLCSDLIQTYECLEF
jgi:hypothetical protein